MAVRDILIIPDKQFLGEVKAVKVDKPLRAS
jgi:hypothetical protein